MINHARGTTLKQTACGDYVALIAHDWLLGGRLWTLWLSQCTTTFDGLAGPPVS
jgi:hypothetical protein